jgi:hypothetical protein
LHEDNTFTLENQDDCAERPFEEICETLITNLTLQFQQLDEEEEEEGPHDQQQEQNIERETKRQKHTE